MMLRHLNLAEVAAELGRSADWLSANWRELVRAKRLPEPVMGRDGGALAWSAAHVYATLDQALPAHLRAAAAAYRAAAATYVTTHSDPDADRVVADDRAALDRRFDRGGA